MIGSIKQTFKFGNYRTDKHVYKRKMGRGISQIEIETFLRKLELNTKFKISKFGSNGFLIHKL